MTVRPSQDQIRAQVRRVLLRLLNHPEEIVPSAPEPAVRRRGVIDAQQVGAARPGARLEIPAGALITPIARDLALERGVTLVPAGADADKTDAPPERAIAIGADHGGFQLKETLKPTLIELGWQPLDCGTHSPDSVDYPDYAYAVARLVADGRAKWGIIIDGAGIGSCMAANKVPGIRAAMCYDLASATNSREHNHANVLTLGAGFIGPNLAKQVVQTWLEVPFGGGRHARRVDQITAIERRFLKG